MIMIKLIFSKLTDEDMDNISMFLKKQSVCGMGRVEIINIISNPPNKETRQHRGRGNLPWYEP